MANTYMPLDPMHESTRQTLDDLHGPLLHLHKTLLEIERRAYEKVNGRVSPNDLLKLALYHERFAWLRELSTLIVSVEELLESEEAVEEDNARSLLTQMRTLLVPSETGDEFGRKYFAALQADPGAVLAHRAVTQILSTGDRGLS